MTTPPIFPSLSTIDIVSHKKPKFATKVQTSASLREVRGAFASYPIWEFELNVNALNAGASPVGGALAQEYQAMLGLFLNSFGMFGTFLYRDPADNQVTGQALATGDGITTTFALIRTLAGWIEPVGYVTTKPTVRVSGSAVTAFTLNAPNSITFAAAPANGAPIVGDFSYYFLCRFLEDQHDYAQVWNQMHELQSLKFTSVKP
jgi:hypothetical protein